MSAGGAAIQCKSWLPGETAAEAVVYRNGNENKPGECARGTKLQVTIARLWEMWNGESVAKYAALRTICAVLNRGRTKPAPGCEGQPIPQGETSPTLTSDARVVIGQQTNRARTTEQTAIEDAQPMSTESHQTP